MPNLNARVLVADVAPLSDPDIMSKAIAKLSDARQAKALACKHILQRQLSVGAGLLLDRLLQPFGKRERDMQYQLNEHGKPFFVNAPDLLFNVSHSGTKVAATIMQANSSTHKLTNSPTHKLNNSQTHKLTNSQTSIGIDIQKITQARLGVARKVFSSDDYMLLSTIDEGPLRDQLFTRLWTEYEARGKAIGCGITWGDTDTNSPTHKLTNSKSHKLFPFSIEGYLGTLCIMVGPGPL